MGAGHSGVGGMGGAASPERCNRNSGSVVVGDFQRPGRGGGLRGGEPLPPPLSGTGSGRSCLALKRGWFRFRVVSGVV